MNWRYDDLVTFLTVVEAGGITAAADRLKLTKSVVSQRVSTLEAALDLQLLQRSTRVVRTTDDGQALYERMRPLVDDMHAGVERIASRSGSLTGRLRITVPLSFGNMYLAPIVAGFAKKNPDLELVLDLEDRFVDLVRDGYDVAVRIGNLQDSSLMARKLADEPRFVVCSPDYAAEHGMPKDVADLANHRCLDYALVQNRQLWQFESGEEGGPERSVALTSRIIVNNGDIMRDLAIAGLGLIMAPRFLVRAALADGRLIVALPEARPKPYAIYVIYPPAGTLSPKVRAFVDHMVEAFHRLHQD